MALQAEIDKARSDIRSDGYAVSIGEWLSIYEKGELDIHPEFQRFFRWTPYQKSRLIESTLLGIPIPQIFVAQRPDGVWDVVDGLQRLSTLFQFAGVLKGEEGELLPPLALEATKYLPSLQGMVWEDEKHPDRALSQAQRLLIKRAKIEVSIILKESSESTKFELFQRLNTGGSQLSDQELRNSIIVMLNRDFYQRLKGLAQDENFRECTSLTDRALEEQYDMELVLRFLVFRSISRTDLSKLADIGEFLTDKAREVATNAAFPVQEEEEVFRDTFRLLNKALGANSCRKYDPRKRRFAGGFLLSAFEGVALGVGYNIARYRLNAAELKARVQELWLDEAFTGSTGSGVRASSRIPRVVPIGRKHFAK